MRNALLILVFGGIIVWITNQTWAAFFVALVILAFIAHPKDRLGNRLDDDNRRG